MKSIAFFLLFLGLVSLSMARSSFLDDLFVPTVNTIEYSNVNCSATDTCAGKGDTCAGNYPSSAGCSKTNGTCCAMGLYCTVNKTCETDTYEASCGSASDCLPKGVFTCYNKTCQYLLGNGDECTESALCSSNNCANGTCQGVGLGGQCTFGSSDCNFGLYCKMSSTGMNATCSNTTAQGGSCYSSAECYPGNVCFASTFANTTMTCQQIGTQGAGLPCTTYACSSGYTCQNTGSSTNQNFTCVSVNTSSVVCTNTANCTGGICTCSPVTGSSYCVGPTFNNPCTEEELNLIQCLADSDCSGESEAPDSCCQQKCSSDYKKAYSCSCSLTNSVLGKCSYNQYCGGFPVWAIIVIIVVAIVLVLAIVLLVFFMMRRRRQYDSI